MTYGGEEVQCDRWRRTFQAALLPIQDNRHAWDAMSGCSLVPTQVSERADVLSYVLTSLRLKCSTTQPLFFVIKANGKKQEIVLLLCTPPLRYHPHLVENKFQFKAACLLSKHFM